MQKLARVLLDSIEQLAFLLTPEGKVLDVNRAALTAFAITTEQALGALLPELLGSAHDGSGSASDGLGPAISRAAQGAPAHCALTIAATEKQDAGRHLELTVRPLCEEDGRVTVLVAEGRDVTGDQIQQQFKKRADALDRLRHRLQELLAEAPVGVGFVCGPEHRWNYVNDAYVRLTGRQRAADFLGKTTRDTLPELEEQGFHRLLDQVYRSGEPFVGREVKARVDRSGSGQQEDGYFDFTYRPVRDEAGNVEGVYIFSQEVTEKVKGRKQVEENAERLRIAQAAAQIGSWEWDPIHGANVLSPELHRIFGTDAEDADRQEKWRSHVYPADQQRVELLMYEGHRLGTMEFE